MTLACLGLTGCEAFSAIADCGVQRPTGLQARDLADLYLLRVPRSTALFEPPSSLTLQADGTLIAAGLPPEVSDVAAGRGTWELVSEEDLRGDVAITIQQSDEAFDFSLDVTGSRDRPVLVAYVDDPDECRTLRFAP